MRDVYKTGYLLNYIRVKKFIKSIGYSKMSVNKRLLKSILLT